MTLLTPALAIAGLCAVAVPILIHLLARQRRKPIEWAAMRFLIEAFRKHRRRLQLEQLILLATRCLILALLGLALARPLLEAAGIIEASGNRALWLVIDDGLAAGVTDENQRAALQAQIEQAVELVKTLGPGDTVGVITAARPARAVLNPPSADHGGVIDLLEGLEAKESPADLPGAFGFIRSAADEFEQTRRQTLVYLFSEFRLGSAALDVPLPSTHVDPEEDVRLLATPPASEARGNVQVIAIEPVRNVILPGATDGSGQVTVRVRRTGGELGGDVTRVRLAGDGLAPMPPQTITWQPGESEANAEFNVGFGTATDREIAVIASIDDDALNADNQRYAVLDLRSQIRVLLIDRRSFGFEQTLDRLTAGQWIRRALEPMEKGPIQIVEAEPAALDLADVRTADVAILPRPDLLTDVGWSIVRQFVERDGLLIIVPPSEVNVHQWTSHLQTDLGLPWRLSLEVVEHAENLGLADEQPATEILRLISSELGELSRPVLVQRMLPVERETLAAGAAQTLLALADGTPLLIAGNPGEAQVENGTTAESREGEGAKPQAAARGLVLYLAVAPEMSWTNLPSKPLMLPLFQEMVRQGLSMIRAAQRINVGDQPALANAPAARDLVGPQGQRIALDSNHRPLQPLDRSGVYAIHDQSDQAVGMLAVNVDPRAGQTDVQSAAAVETWLNNSGPWSTLEGGAAAAALGASAGGSPISGLLLMLVLALLALETLLARWFSHAYRSDALAPTLLPAHAHGRASRATESVA